MFKIAFVIFREFLEIALLLGIIIAVTKNILNSRFYIITGIMLGVFCASLFAFFTRMLSISYGGMGDEIFDAAVILLTSAVISWTVVWMQGYGAKIKKEMSSLTNKINTGMMSKLMLTLMVAMTIFREGSEIILFVYSISSVENIDVNDYFLGLAIGSLLGFGVGMAIYLGLINFASKYIFKISSLLLMLIAAGLASEAAGILTSSGIITIMTDELWDSSWLISDNSLTGKVSRMLIGYSARPNGMQVSFYLGTIFLIIFLTKLKNYCSSVQANRGSNV